MAEWKNYFEKYKESPVSNAVTAATQKSSILIITSMNNLPECQHILAGYIYKRHEILIFHQDDHKHQQRCPTDQADHTNMKAVFFHEYQRIIF